MIENINNDDVALLLLSVTLCVYVVLFFVDRPMLLSALGFLHGDRRATAVGYACARVCEIFGNGRRKDDQQILYVCPSPLNPDDPSAAIEKRLIAVFRFFRSCLSFSH